MPTSKRLRSLVAVPVVTAGLLAGTMSIAPAADAGGAHHRHHTWRYWHIQKGRHIALNQIGDPYAYGAAGPGRFDCSGLIYYSFRKAGFRHVPRTSDAQAAHMRHIRKKDMRRGDFMFFTDGGGVYHVGVFLRWVNGRALMLHSPQEGERVRREHPWTTQWFAGTLRGL
ncbi:cell wall-associated NlpC family hydrolase [Nocardioides ginsengisegetis]|uniref:Cell wall-associated NlpC family hydrolase n=1 Tax=Nocardioides ginsengisegetis TaxID=661491 RepID=A0A7W3PA53_9ACTN|nr:NlpC/P60 family protein [Nocardioides ginsengisegetis]MBA8804390.1 cell wall-associated NlpC family hydrolase [Nocardioides ginsengisegetis]